MDVDTAMERITEVQNRIQKADRETDALEKELKKERGLLDAVSPIRSCILIFPESFTLKK